MSETNLIKQKIKSQWNALGKVDKNILRFYLQLSEEDLLKRGQQYVEMAEGETNEKRQRDLLKQVELYKIAYLLKVHEIPVRGGKRKTRRVRKTRKLRR